MAALYNKKAARKLDRIDRKLWKLERKMDKLIREYKETTKKL